MQRGKNARQEEFLLSRYFASLNKNFSVMHARSICSLIREASAQTEAIYGERKKIMNYNQKEEMKREAATATSAQPEARGEQLLLPIRRLKEYRTAEETIILSEQILIIQCAWCGKDKQLLWTPGDACISHGMCVDCMDRMTQEEE